ncbi:hypothetical protein K0P33_07265 [Pseudomonas sp. ArH3a]|uniref:dermonecrotic toxin domain-containing protein n=1 Tax=Pseudomonas sp. ArH3a TaxID=2862945 RepID=UPI001F57A363|nr:hypothetical protein [Pseudomonas sp. ArH3a]UNM21248.1 hypothetical protein K0P33_07265 [Pseudomonas sp. ArH3a]
MHSSLPSSQESLVDDPQSVQADSAPLDPSSPLTLPVVPPASLSTDEQQIHLIRELDRLSSRTHELLRQQPSPDSLYQQQLAAIFPDMHRPINPNQIFYSCYREDQQGQKQRLSSEPLGLLLKRLRAPDAEAYLAQEAGAFFRESGTLDADKRLPSVVPTATLASVLEVAITVSLNSFWRTARDAHPNPEEQLVALRRQLLAHQLALRSVDGTLSANGRTLADNVLKYPSAAAREQAFSADNRPAVHRLTLEGGSDFAGAFILSTGDGTPPTGSVMLYSPSEEFEEFESLERLNETVSTRLQAGGSAGKLLIASLPTAARAGLSNRPMLAAHPSQISADVMTDSIRSLRIRQYFAIREALRQETLPSTGALDQVADLTPQLNATDAFTQRNLRLIEVEPSWLKTADGQDQVRYRQLEKAMIESNQALAPLLEKVSTLEAFSQEETDTVLKQQKPAYANVDIAPYRSLVRLRVSASSAYKATGYRDEETATVYVSEDRKINIPQFMSGRKLTWGTWSTQVIVDLRTLGSYTQRNVDPWSAHDIHRTISATATVVDTAGKQWGTLDNADLRALATEADIGRKYAEYLRSAFSHTGAGNTFATAWQRAYAAKINQDSLESRLNPDASKLFIFQTPGSGFDWIKAITEHPDSTTRPRVNAFEIVVNLLVMGGAQERGQGGQVINNVLVINRKGTKPQGVSVLHTPDAPDGVPFRELVNGLAELDTLKAKPEWKAYFIPRMATKDAQEITRIFNDTRGVHRYALTPITGHFHAYLYSAQLGFQLAHADHRSRSNAEISRESAVNAFMFGAEIADSLLGLIPGKPALSLLRQSIHKGLARAKQLGHRIPGLVNKIDPGKKASIAMSGASIRPLEPAWIDVAPYRLPKQTDSFFDVERFARMNQYALSRQSGSAPIFFDRHNNPLIAMRDDAGRYHLFQSYAEGGARYVKDPAGNNVDFMVVPGDAKSWKPRFERNAKGGGSVLGALRPLTAAQQVDADLIAALRVYSKESDIRISEELIEKLSESQKKNLLTNARQQVGGHVDEAEFRRRLSEHHRLSPRAKNVLRNALLNLQSELDIYYHLNGSARFFIPPLSASEQDQLFNKVKRIIGKNENFSKQIRYSISITDTDTGAQFAGYAITQRQLNALKKFSEKYELSTWERDVFEAFLGEHGRQATINKIASDHNITPQAALDQLLADGETLQVYRAFRAKKFKEKLERLQVPSYSEDFKKSGVPYVVISRGNPSGPQAGAHMVDSNTITKFENELPQFSTPLEFETPRVQTHKIDKPSTRPKPSTVPDPIPIRDPAINIVKLDELADTQKGLLPDNAKAKLEHIIQDIEAGRVSRKKIGNYTYVDLPQAQEGAGRGRWRVAIERAGQENEKDLFIIRGVFDYHASKPVAWGV